MSQNPHRPSKHEPKPAPEASFTRPGFDEVYASNFAAVWRSARRLGVPESAVDDVVQEVFVAVHRQLEQFEGRGTVKSWVFGILVRVVSNHRRTHRRKGAGRATSALVADPEGLIDEADGPLECLHNREASLILREVLGRMEESRAALLIMAELEGMSAPEIAEATGVNLNTIYSRLRAAREEFSQKLRQQRLRKRPA